MKLIASSILFCLAVEDSTSNSSFPVLNPLALTHFLLGAVKRSPATCCVFFSLYPCASQSLHLLGLANFVPSFLSRYTLPSPWQLGQVYAVVL